MTTVTTPSSLALVPSLETASRAAKSAPVSQGHGKFISKPHAGFRRVP